MKIEKVDPHHHLWSLGSTHYPMLSAPPAERFIGNTGKLRFDFGPREFRACAAAQNVTRSVYVESHFAPPIEETAFVQAIADAHGFPNAILGRTDLGAPDLDAQLDTHMRAPLFRGVRAMVNWDADPHLQGAPRGLLQNPAWSEGYGELGRRGLIAEIMALPAQLADLATLARQWPQTRLIVGHTGIPLRRDPLEHQTWRDGMALLAALPHVVVKISGLGMVDHNWTRDSIRPLVEETIALFAPARCMFASNFPIDGLYADYDRVWDAFDDISANFSPTERAALFSDTARGIFQIA